MNYTKLSTFLESNDEYPFLLGAFFSRYKLSDDESIFYTLSTFKESKFVPNVYQYELDYLEILNHHSEIKKWLLQKHTKDGRVKKALMYFALDNDLCLNENEFFTKIYIKIIKSDFFNSDCITHKLPFIRAFFELRGSIDTNRPYISPDYFYSSKSEVRRATMLIDNFKIPSNCLNFNFRSLQRQFVENMHKRNDQMRIDLKWYASNIGLINPYKIKIIKNVYKFDIDNTKSNKNVTYFICESPSSNDKNTFEKRILFYINCIYDKELDNLQLKELRQQLHFDKTESSEFKRDLNIINIAKILLPDECSACKNKYDLKDRSFIKRSNNKLYTEIHHIISLGRNKSLDTLENLTKLCPVCHRALSKGAAKQEYQKELISNILESNVENLNFASEIFNTTDKNKLVESIFQHLR